MTTTTSAPPTFEARAGDAFAPLGRSFLALPEKARRWLAGELTDEDYGQELRLARQDAAQALADVSALPAHPARAFYLATATLYLVHVDTHAASIRHEHREQVALLARRLRELADRIFDRGHVLVDPDAFEGGDDVTINLPEEVPDWVAEGLAPGPPLEPSPPPPPADTPPLRQATRPVQPEADWLAAVAAAGAPDELDLGGDVAAQARAYVAAAEALRDEPDPDVDGGRERSAILRLGWLVKADAARAQQLGLDGIAQIIADIELPV